MDIPKYFKGNVRLVFAAIFPGVETFRPEESRKLMEVYSKWLPAVGYRAPQTVIYEHFSIYYKLAETYDEVVIVESASDVENVIRSEGKVGFLLHLEGA